jgi:hypothetical protein
MVSPVTNDAPMMAVASMSPPTIRALRARRRTTLRLAIRRKTRFRTALTAMTPNATAITATSAVASVSTGTPRTRSTARRPQLRSPTGTSATSTSYRSRPGGAANSVT